MSLDSDYGPMAEFKIEDGAPWSPFGIYHSQVIINEFGKIPETAIKIELPKQLERIVGNFYRLKGDDLQYFRANTIGKFIIVAKKGAESARHLAAWNYR